MHLSIKFPGWRLLLRLLLGFSLLLLVVLAWASTVVVRGSNGLLYSSVDRLPYNRVGLLLGTSPRLSNGEPNYFFVHRIDAAAMLYFKGKIRYILVSGDNRRRSYNEPQEMRKALLSRGVPDSAMVLDYAGIRTFDSVVRSKEVFSLDSITIISQCFHNQRAVFIARHKGIAAIGFNAEDVDAYNGFKTKIREYFARVKVILDLWFNVQPHHLGPKVVIGG